MADEEKPGGDPLGLRLYGEALNKALDGVGAFLSAICMPAASASASGRKPKPLEERRRNRETLTFTDREA